jgi:hypothetical protein
MFKGASLFVSKSHFPLQLLTAEERICLIRASLKGASREKSGVD